MRNFSLLMALLGLGLMATACGSSAAPSPTPTDDRAEAASPQATSRSGQQQTSTPTALPTIDARRLAGWKIYVQVIYGCECPPSPAAGVVSAIAIPPSQVEATNLTPITLEIYHESMSQPVEVPLEFSDTIIDSCGLDFSGTLRGFGGSQRVLTEDGLPRQQPNVVVLPSTPLQVRLLVMDDVQQRYWVTVTPTDICPAVS